MLGEHEKHFGQQCQSHCDVEHSESLASTTSTRSEIIYALIFSQSLDNTNFFFEGSASEDEPRSLVAHFRESCRDYTRDLGAGTAIFLTSRGRLLVLMLMGRLGTELAWSRLPRRTTITITQFATVQHSDSAHCFYRESKGGWKAGYLLWAQSIN